MRRKTPEVNYIEDGDTKTWKEYNQNGNNDGSAKSKDMGVNPVLHFVITNRSEISHVSLPRANESMNCSNCGQVIDTGDKFLLIEKSDGSRKNRFHFCNNCSH